MAGDDGLAAGRSTSSWCSTGPTSPEQPSRHRPARAAAVRPLSDRQEQHRSERCPRRIGEFVRWLVRDSGWIVTTAGAAAAGRSAPATCACCSGASSPIRTTSPASYVEALESRGVPHLLVGGKTFHEREEVDAMRTALSAIEWPEDELSVFATLAWSAVRARRGGAARVSRAGPRAVAGRPCLPSLPPARRPAAPPAPRLARRSTRCAGCTRAATTGRWRTRSAGSSTRRARTPGSCCGRAASRCWPTFSISPNWRASTRAEGGLSFRGFVDTLRAAADRAQAPEAPILEEGSEGVRLMTVHKAKGLEFPVVILADITCGLSRDDAQRYLDSSRGLVRDAASPGWAPLDLHRKQRPRGAPRRRRGGPARLRRRDTRARHARRSRGRRRAVQRWLGQPAECTRSIRRSPSEAIAAARGRHAAVRRARTPCSSDLMASMPANATVRPGART